MALGDALPLQKSGVRDKEGNLLTDDPARSGVIGWIGRQPQTAWIYERLERIARTVNEQIYRYDLVGFSDPLQYTVYSGTEGDHFAWHSDHQQMRLPRKLSFSLQLSDPGAYEGCDLEIFNGSRLPAAAPRARGLLVLFPSYAMHRVTPIRAGTRKALVFWTAGPHFR